MSDNISATTKERFVLQRGTDNNKWQLCPKCFGKGYIEEKNDEGLYKRCSVCEGRKLINIDTGLPPDKQ